MKIEVKNLKKKFNENFVLKDISLTILKNKSTIILGQSGCGKSVLIKTIYQLLSYNSGSILYDNKSEVDIDKFSMLFQYGALFDSLKISENIAFTDFINNKKNFNKKVLSLMNDVGLDKSIYDKYPSELSGGMKKRASLARALYKNPKVIFLDEPTTGLDPINSDKINDLIVRVITKRKITAVSITHDIKSAIKTGDNYYFIDNGVIKDKGDCKKILKTKNKFFKSFIAGAKY
tara:strand:- start:753 stop:1451 length:699 start_codon:yes stop_codon:yes gene_type:complete